MALVAISVASVVMLRSYVETRQDNALQSAFSQYANQPVRDGARQRAAGRRAR